MMFPRNGQLPISTFIGRSWLWGLRNYLNTFWGRRLNANPFNDNHERINRQPTKYAGSDEIARMLCKEGTVSNLPRGDPGPHGSQRPLTTHPPEPYLARQWDPCALVAIASKPRDKLPSTAVSDLGVVGGVSSRLLFFLFSLRRNPHE